VQPKTILAEEVVEFWSKLMENENFKHILYRLIQRFEADLFFNKFMNFSEYEIITDNEKLPSWWHRNNNFILCPKNRTKTVIPNISLHGGHDNCSNFILICNEQSDCNIVVWGDGGLMYYSPSSRIVGSRIALGSGCILIGPGVRNSPGITLNCRNGGKIIIYRDSLIASGVAINTDDCHTIFSLSNGVRLNPFGGVVFINEHVWIGQQAMIMGNCSIGKNTVIGAFSFVRGNDFPENIILAGTPARVVAQGVNWDYRDIPPGTDMRNGFP
jgi:acetyltransferase-like isoleucine patch superfamily enzyme